MNLSPTGEGALTAREGRRKNSFKDSVGVWTIGESVCFGSAHSRFFNSASTASGITAARRFSPATASIVSKVPSRKRTGITSGSFAFGMRRGVATAHRVA